MISSRIGKALPSMARGNKQKGVRVSKPKEVATMIASISDGAIVVRTWISSHSGLTARSSEGRRGDLRRRNERFLKMPVGQPRRVLSISLPGDQAQQLTDPNGELEGFPHKNSCVAHQASMKLLTYSEYCYCRCISVTISSRSDGFLHRAGLRRRNSPQCRREPDYGIRPHRYPHPRDRAEE